MSFNDLTVYFVLETILFVCTVVNNALDAIVFLLLLSTVYAMFFFIITTECLLASTLCKMFAILPHLDFSFYLGCVFIFLKR